MKKIVNNKLYVQTGDVIFMVLYEFDELPVSLSGRAFEKFHSVTENKTKEYIEVETEEEKDFINNMDFIYSKNYLDILDCPHFKEEFENIKERIINLEESKNDIDDISNDIELLKLKHKYNSLVDYAQERIEVSCKTCDNEKCSNEDSLKIGLDKDGKPVGNNCLLYSNQLFDIKKYQFKYSNY